MTNGRGAEFEYSRLGVSESKRKSRCGTYGIERTKTKKLLWAATAVLLFATVSRAQGTPAAEVAVGYSHFQIIKGLTIAMDGGSGSAAFNANDWFGVVGDLGVYRNEPCCVDLTATTYMFGPRFSYRKSDRVVPFGQAIFGGSNFSTTFNGVSGSGGNHFAFGIGGGFDVVLGRSGKVVLRTQGEYFGVRVNGSVLSNVRLSLGIVFRIGKK
jgi:outer membrane immunogenic protein